MQAVAFYTNGSYREQSGRAYCVHVVQSGRATVQQPEPYKSDYM